VVGARRDGVFGARRTKEIGRRLALGDVPRQLMAMVCVKCRGCRRWRSQSRVGTSLLPSAFKSMRFGIAPNDPAALCDAAFVLITVALTRVSRSHDDHHCP
jgi:hypothetical protein